MKSVQTCVVLLWVEGACSGCLPIACTGLQVQNLLYPRAGVRICGTAVSLGSYTVALYMCEGSSAGNIPILVANSPNTPKNILIEKKNNEYQVSSLVRRPVSLSVIRSVGLHVSCMPVNLYLRITFLLSLMTAK